MKYSVLPTILYGAGYPDTIKLIVRMSTQTTSLQVHGYIDDFNKEKSFMGFPILGTRELLKQITLAEYQFVNNVFSNTNARAQVGALLDAYHCNLLSLIDPEIDTTYAEIGRGAVIMKGAQLGARVKIGEYCTVRMNTVVNHDNVLGDYVFVGPGVTLCGHVTIGKGAYIGAGSVVKEHVHIGDNAIVGAGSVVIQDVKQGIKVAGVPAREI